MYTTRLIEDINLPFGFRWIVMKYRNYILVGREFYKDKDSALNAIKNIED